MVGLTAHNRCISIQIWAVPFLRYIQQSINVFASGARVEGLIPSPATILSRVGEMISRVINKKNVSCFKNSYLKILTFLKNYDIIFIEKVKGRKEIK